MLRAACLVLLLAAAAPALAQTKSPNDSAKEAEDIAREALEKLMRAMSAVMKSIPQYEMPETLPNGDIIIRRKKPDEPKPPPGKEERT